jgi:hypothetical protein
MPCATVSKTSDPHISLSAAQHPSATCLDYAWQVQVVQNTLERKDVQQCPVVCKPP